MVWTHTHTLMYMSPHIPVQVYLCLGKGLLHLLQVGQEPHVPAHLVRRLRDAAQHRQHLLYICFIYSVFACLFLYLVFFFSALAPVVSTAVVFLPRLTPNKQNSNKITRDIRRPYWLLSPTSTALQLQQQQQFMLICIYHIYLSYCIPFGKKKKSHKRII